MQLPCLRLFWAEYLPAAAKRELIMMKSEYVIKFLVDSFRASAYRKLVTLSNTSLRFVVHAHIYVVVCAQSCCERILVWAQTCPSFHSKCRYYKKANEIPSLEPSIPVFV